MQCQHPPVALHPTGRTSHSLHTVQRTQSVRACCHPSSLPLARSLQPRQPPCAARMFQACSHHGLTALAAPLPQSPRWPPSPSSGHRCLTTESFPARPVENNTHPPPRPPPTLAQSIYTTICLPANLQHLLPSVSSMRGRRDTASALCRVLSNI